MSFNSIKINNSDTSYTHSIFDISEYTGKQYDNLSSALTDVPTEKQSGGMTVCYVQTSDNNYVQYRLTADDWSTNTEDWAIDDEGVYVENPEYVYVKTDGEGKILWVIKTDGSIYYGAGCPQQVKDYIEEKISSLSQIQEELDNKVDKEKGKSLIDEEILESLSVIEDQEGRSEITTDSEGKIISYRDSDGIKHENEISIEKAFLNTLNVRQFNIIGIPDNVSVTDVYLDKPKFAEIYFYGYLPTDMSSDRVPTILDWVYKVNGQILFSAKCTLAIQGHGSARYDKKGYTFEPINANGDAINIKWGDMIAIDSFHLKAYFNDKTFSRGLGGPKVWRKMIEQLPYPYNKVNNKSYNIAKGQKVDSICIADAKYSEDGFPFAMYLNDKFYGLYVVKLKKSRKNYGMEKSNKNEIFLDSLGFDEAPGHSAKLNDSFDAGAWDLKNPKLKGYEEGGEITDASVLANIERLFNFTNNLETMYDQHEDYIVLSHWLTWFIHCELIGDVDKDGNNLELATWDGIHWSILPYDMDLSVGCYAGSIQQSYSGNILTPEFYSTFRACYLQELKELYTKLRKSGCIEINNLYKTYLEQIEAIPRFMYEKEYELWPNGSWIDDTIFPNIGQIYTYLESRIEYLDSNWLLDLNNN